MIIYAKYRDNISTAVSMDWLSDTKEYSMRITEDDECTYSSLDQSAANRTYDAHMMVLENLGIFLPDLYLRSWKNMGCKDSGPVVRS